MLSGDVSSQTQPRFERATRSLATFVRSHRSLRSLATQRSASLIHSVHGLAHSLRSLPRGTVEILEYACSRCDCVSRVQTRVSSSLETRPMYGTP